MPQIPVRIEEAEELDKKLSNMCEQKSAILVAEGGTFSNIFPKAMNRSKIFRRKYMVALGTGRLLFTEVAEVSLYFDYQEKSAEIQITRRAIEDMDNILPEIRQYLYRLGLAINALSQSDNGRWEQLGIERCWVERYCKRREKYS